MKVENKKTVEVNLNESALHPVLNFYQGDTNIIEFVLKSDTLDADLSKLTSIHLNVQRPDQLVITRELQAYGNKVTYELGQEEMALIGQGTVNLQLFEDNKRLTAVTIKVNIAETFGVDPEIITGDGEISAGEVPDPAQIYRKLSDKITEADLADEVKAKLGGSVVPIAAPQAQETVRVLKQADISKNANNKDTFTVDDKGNVTTAAEFLFGPNNVTAAFMPVGINEVTLKLDKKQHWLGVGANEDLSQFALVGIGNLKIIGQVTVKPYGLATYANYTQTDLDDTHTYTPGQEYKVVNGENDVALYYKSGDTFKLWYRVLKAAYTLNNETTMNWFTPRLGAAGGANTDDKTNQTLMTEVKLIERTEPQEKETVRVLKQVDIAKNASTTNTFTVDESGTITSDTDFTSFNEANVPVLFFPKGVDEITFEADDELTWIVAGADEALNEFALVGIGANKNCAHVSIAPYVFSNKVEYTRTALDSSHVYAVGKTYKVVNSETALVFYYKDGEEFKLWFRLIKEAIQLHDGTQMNWHTPRLGAAAGIADQDRTNRTLLTKVNVMERTPIGGSRVVDLSNYATKADLEKALGEDPTKKKYAVLVVAGQSNAVGCDESPVDSIFSYGQHDRVKQLGIHGANNLKIIPLGHCAENFENLAIDRYTNKANPTLKGTKGIHLPLAKMLLDKIPSDYEILVISVAHGGTGFTVGESGAYDEKGKKPQELIRQKWGKDTVYYRAMIDRIEYALSLNPANYFIGTVWCQGEADVADPAGHKTAFEAMTEAFFNHFNGGQYKNRVKKGTWDRSQWFIFETTNHWKAMQGAQTIWSQYQAWKPENYVPIADETKTNTEPSTTSPSAPTSHYGQNAYADVIAPAVYEKMVETKAV